jgi:hypothetical protein
VSAESPSKSPLTPQKKQKKTLKNHARSPCKIWEPYDNPFWKNSDGGRKKEEKREKRKRREKVNDYSGTIVSERRQWRTHTLGPKVKKKK